MLGEPAMSGASGTKTGGYRNASDSNLPSISNSNRQTLENFENGSNPGFQRRDLTSAENLNGSNSFSMMNRGYQEEVK